MSSTLKIIEQLNFQFKVLNSSLFDSQLKPIKIDIQNLNSKNILALYTSHQYGTQQPTILFSYEFIGKYQALTEEKDKNALCASTLLHEMIHQYCIENEISDIDETRKHTEAFATEAEMHGLMAFATDTEGFITYLDPDYEYLWQMLDADSDKLL